MDQACPHKFWSKSLDPKGKRSLLVKKYWLKRNRIFISLVQIYKPYSIIRSRFHLYPLLWAINFNIIPKFLLDPIRFKNFDPSLISWIWLTLVQYSYSNNSIPTPRSWGPIWSKKIIDFVPKIIVVTQKNFDTFFWFFGNFFTFLLLSNWSTWHTCSTVGRWCSPSNYTYALGMFVLLH